MKKKEFKAALVVALTESGIESTIEANVEGAVCKLGRKLRADTTEVKWDEKDVATAVSFYKEYDVKPEKVVAKTKKVAAKPMKKAPTKAKAPAKVAVAKKKPVPKKK